MICGSCIQRELVSHGKPIGGIHVHVMIFKLINIWEYRDNQAKLNLLFFIQLDAIILSPRVRVMK